MTATVFYPGSFDPVTNGHLDVIKRAATLFDEVVIGVGVHHGKKALFSDQERVEILEAVVQGSDGVDEGRVRVVTFDDLSIAAAKRVGARAIVRGLRDSGDFRYEIQMAGMNGAMNDGIDTVFLAASPGVRHIASKFVRQIAAMGGDVTPFVPDIVADALSKKFDA